MKNTVKIIVSAILVLCMCVGLVSTAFADGAVATDGTITISNAKYYKIDGAGRLVTASVDFPVKYSAMLTQSVTVMKNGREVVLRAGTICATAQTSHGESVVFENLPRASYSIVAESDNFGISSMPVPMSVDLTTNSSASVSPIFKSRQIIANIYRLGEKSDGTRVQLQNAEIGLYGISASSFTPGGDDIMSIGSQSSTMSSGSDFDPLLPGSEPVLLASVYTDVDGIATFNVAVAPYVSYMFKEIEPPEGQNKSTTEISFVFPSDKISYEFVTSQALLSDYVDGDEPEPETKKVLILGDEYVFGVCDNGTGTTTTSEHALMNAVAANSEYDISDYGALGAGYGNHPDNMINRAGVSNYDIIVICLGMNDCVLPMYAASKPGDANGDGIITAADAAVVLRYVVKLITIDEENLLNADANQDGKITAADAALILRYIVGKNDLPNRTGLYDCMVGCINLLKSKANPSAKIYIIGPWTQNKDYDSVEESCYTSKAQVAEALQDICENAGVIFVDARGGVEGVRGVIGTSGYPTASGYKKIGKWLANIIK